MWRCSSCVCCFCCSCSVLCVVCCVLRAPPNGAAAGRRDSFFLPQGHLTVALGVLFLYSKGHPTMALGVLFPYRGCHPTVALAVLFLYPEGHPTMTLGMLFPYVLLGTSGCGHQSRCTPWQDVPLTYLGLSGCGFLSQCTRQVGLPLYPQDLLSLSIAFPGGRRGWRGCGAGENAAPTPPSTAMLRESDSWG